MWYWVSQLVKANNSLRDDVGMVLQAPLLCMALMVVGNLMLVPIERP